MALSRRGRAGGLTPIFLRRSGRHRNARGPTHSHAGPGEARGVGRPGSRQTKTERPRLKRETLPSLSLTQMCSSPPPPPPHSLPSTMDKRAWPFSPLLKERGGGGSAVGGTVGVEPGGPAGKVKFTFFNFPLKGSLFRTPPKTGRDNVEIQVRQTNLVARLLLKKKIYTPDSVY